MRDINFSPKHTQIKNFTNDTSLSSLIINFQSRFPINLLTTPSTETIAMHHCNQVEIFESVFFFDSPDQIRN